MRENIFESEEEARLILNTYCKQKACEGLESYWTHISGHDLDIAIDRAKKAGLIKQSAFEEAEKSYKKYVSCARGLLDSEDGSYILIEKLWKAIVELKERIKNET